MGGIREGMGTRMTPNLARLAEIEARVQAATKGPLVAEGTTVYVDAGIQPHVAYFHDGARNSLMDSGEANAELFAHAPDDLIYLLRELRAAWERIGELEGRQGAEAKAE